MFSASIWKDLGPRTQLLPYRLGVREEELSSAKYTVPTIFIVFGEGVEGWLGLGVLTLELGNADGALPPPPPPPQEATKIPASIIWSGKHMFFIKLTMVKILLIYVFHYDT